MTFSKSLKCFECIFFILLTIFLFSYCTPKKARVEKIETKVNKQFYIELPIKPTSGKKWFWMNKESVQLVDSISSFNEVTKTRNGEEAGIELWNFNALKEGQEKLILEFKESKDSAPLMKMTYYVNIR